MKNIPFILTSILLSFSINNNDLFASQSISCPFSYIQEGKAKTDNFTMEVPDDWDVDQQPNNWYVFSSKDGQKQIRLKCYLVQNTKKFKNKRELCEFGLECIHKELYPEQPLANQPMVLGKKGHSFLEIFSKANEGEDPSYILNMSSIGVDEEDINKNGLSNPSTLVIVNTESSVFCDPYLMNLISSIEYQAN